MGWFSATFSWYLATLVVAGAFAPVALLLFRHSCNAGASVVRPLGSLLLVWPAWYLASVGSVPFARRTLWLTVLIGAIIGWSLALRKGVVTRAALRHVALAEAGFLLCFAAFVWFHGFGPAIWDQEKPSDLMMLSSAMRAEHMPPRDAWLAGETTNYYYLGYVILAGFAKLAGTTPATTYNLALATIFGMTVVGVAGVAGNMIGPVIRARTTLLVGGAAATFVVVLGNPWAAVAILKNPERQWNADSIPGRANAFVKGVGWRATRIIFDQSLHDPITEFPFFTFILSDLHPHLIAFPYTVMALAFAWMLLHLDEQGEAGGFFRLLPRLALSGGVIGSLYAMNSWDFPTFLLLSVLALGVGLRKQPRLQRLLAIAVLVFAALACWAPFYLQFTSPTRPADNAVARATESIPMLGGIAGSVALFDAERTSIPEYLSMFGFMYAIGLAFILIQGWQRGPKPSHFLTQGVTAVIAFLLLIGAILLPAPLLVAVGWPLLAIVYLLRQDHRMTTTNVVLGLFGVAFTLTLGLEFVYLRDFFDTRMNSVFKIYFQIWLLMGIGSAVAGALLWSSLRRERVGKWVLSIGMVVILLGGLTYPVVASKQWLDWRSPERAWVGIDGLAYLNTTGQSAEYAALTWLWQNGHADDVMLAAGGCEWSAMIGRPAAATGVPTILGWAGHEEQWHLNPDDDRSNRTQRASDITMLYQRLPPDLVAKYGITLIYIGAAEMKGGDKRPGADCAPGPFPNASNPNFPGPGWTQVFWNDGTRVYRRTGP